MAESNSAGIWAFVVDTQNNAWGFYRELGAYLTGKTGDDFVGEDYATLFRKETNRRFFKNVVAFPNHQGCPQSAFVINSPNKSQAGVGIYLNKYPAPMQIATLQIRALGFNEARQKLEPQIKEVISVCGFRLLDLHRQTKEVKRWSPFDDINAYLYRYIVEKKFLTFQQKSGKLSLDKTTRYDSSRPKCQCNVGGNR